MAGAVARCFGDLGVGLCGGGCVLEPGDSPTENSACFTPCVRGGAPLSVTSDSSIAVKTFTRVRAIANLLRLAAVSEFLSGVTTGAAARRW